ncbi:MAG TPA: MarR family transcriptional regulator [Fontimonas sp.]
MKPLTALPKAEHPHAANRSLPARLMAVAHFAQLQTMERLALGRRRGRLSLTHAGYLITLAGSDCSPGELAVRLRISKQACSKTLRELSALGLIKRRVNPQDSRSSLLSLSVRGTELLGEGVEASNAIQQQVSAAIGAAGLRSLIGILERLCLALDLERPSRFAALEDSLEAKTGSRPARLSVLLPRLSALFRQRLSAAVRQQGYADLRPGIGQMLGMVNDEGRRLQSIASLLGISKQAVAATAAELEQLGYAARRGDAEDRRQVVVSLTPRGRKLLRDVATGVDRLEADIRAVLGEADYRLLDEAMSRFYAEITGRYDSAGALRDRIQQLSSQLIDELGTTGARALAQQLIGITRGKS